MKNLLIGVLAFWLPATALASYPREGSFFFQSEPQGNLIKWRLFKTLSQGVEFVLHFTTPPGAAHGRMLVFSDLGHNQRTEVVYIDDASRELMHVVRASQWSEFNPLGEVKPIMPGLLATAINDIGLHQFAVVTRSNGIASYNLKHPGQLNYIVNPGYIDPKVLGNIVDLQAVWISGNQMRIAVSTDENVFLVDINAAGTKTPSLTSPVAISHQHTEVVQMLAFAHYTSAAWLLRIDRHTGQWALEYLTFSGNTKHYFPMPGTPSWLELLDMPLDLKLVYRQDNDVLAINGKGVRSSVAVTALHPRNVHFTKQQHKALTQVDPISAISDVRFGMHWRAPGRFQRLAAAPGMSSSVISTAMVGTTATAPNVATPPNLPLLPIQAVWHDSPMGAPDFLNVLAHVYLRFQTNRKLAANIDPQNMDDQVLLQDMVRAVNANYLYSYFNGAGEQALKSLQLNLGIIMNPYARQLEMAPNVRPGRTVSLRKLAAWLADNQCGPQIARSVHGRSTP